MKKSKVEGTLLTLFRGPTDTHVGVGPFLNVSLNYIAGAKDMAHPTEAWLTQQKPGSPRGPHSTLVRQLAAS